jgi:hypothetical protein
MQYAFSLFFLLVVQSANCILLLTNKCEARVYICFTICKSTSILFSFFLFFCFHSLILTQFLLVVHLLINLLLLLVKRRNMRAVKCHPKPIQVQYRRRQKISSPKGIKNVKENYTNHLIVFIRVNQHKRQSL